MEGFAAPFSKSRGIFLENLDYNLIDPALVACVQTDEDIAELLEHIPRFVQKILGGAKTAADLLGLPDDAEDCEHWGVYIDLTLNIGSYFIRIS